MNTKQINQVIANGKQNKNINTKEISDTHHTFGDLYYHRMILFSLFINDHPSISWKSWKHEDGTMFNGDFIVGINTPAGQYSYHYKAKFWKQFKVPELANAPKYDGHTSNDINRLLSVKEYSSETNMDNLIDNIQEAPNEAKIIEALKNSMYFDLIKQYLFDTFNIDYADGQFIDEQNVFSLASLKEFIIQGLNYFY